MPRVKRQPDDIVNYLDPALVFIKSNLDSLVDDLVVGNKKEKREAEYFLKAIAETNLEDFDDSETLSLPAYMLTVLRIKNPMHLVELISSKVELRKDREVIKKKNKKSKVREFIDNFNNQLSFPLFS